jgi:hypothetical protein
VQEVFNRLPQPKLPDLKPRKLKWGSFGLIPLRNMN